MVCCCFISVRFGGKAGGDGDGLFLRKVPINPISPAGFKVSDTTPPAGDPLPDDDEHDGSGEANDWVSTEMPEEVLPVEHDLPPPFGGDSTGGGFPWGDTFLAQLVTTTFVGGILVLASVITPLDIRAELERDGGGWTWSGSRIFESSWWLCAKFDVGTPTAGGIVDELEIFPVNSSPSSESVSNSSPY